MRGSIDAETILQVVLVLILVWLALEAVELAFGLVGTLLWPVTNLVFAGVAVLIVLWLVDSI